MAMNSVKDFADEDAGLHHRGLVVVDLADAERVVEDGWDLMNPRQAARTDNPLVLSTTCMLPGIREYSLGRRGAQGSLTWTVDPTSGRRVVVKSALEGCETSVRELGAHLKCTGHDNVITLLGAITKNKTATLLLDYADCSLRWRSGATERTPQELDEPKLRYIAREILKGVAHVHSRGIAHMDLKPDNVLMTKEGFIRVADFGHARDKAKFPLPLSVDPRSVVTVNYRAPELLLGCHTIDDPKSVDMWSVGCIMLELSSPSREPLFQGRNESDILRSIVEVLGHPDPASFDGLRGVSAHDVQALLRDVPSGERGSSFLESLKPEFRAFMRGLLAYNPRDRVTAAQALSHPWFKGYVADPQAVASAYAPLMPRINDSEEISKEASSIAHNRVALRRHMQALKEVFVDAWLRNNPHRQSSQDIEFKMHYQRWLRTIGDFIEIRHRTHSYMHDIVNMALSASRQHHHRDSFHYNQQRPQYQQHHQQHQQQHQQQQIQRPQQLQSHGPSSHGPHGPSSNGQSSHLPPHLQHRALHQTQVLHQARQGTRDQRDNEVTPPRNQRDQEGTPRDHRERQGTTRRDEGTTRRDDGTTRRDEGTTRRDDGTTRRDDGTTRDHRDKRPYGDDARESSRNVSMKYEGNDRDGPTQRTRTRD